MARVMFDRVTKTFGEVVAVSDFTLEVPDGDFLVLVGPSGCGKSTVLRLLAGLEDLASGQISIGERVINDVAAKDRDIAMVFQTYALYPHMSVFDNMAFGLKLRGTPRADISRRVHEAAETLGLEDLLRRKPGQLSGAQRQRVAPGRAIVRDPAVFLLDEPLSNLDAKLRVQTRAEIRKLHQRLGSTFIYVTHDQTEAMTMAARIAVIDCGRLQQVGTPQELYDRPENLFVAGFIGSPAMNMFDARVSIVGEQVSLDVGPFRIDAPTDRARVLRPYAGQRLVVGMRPEHIHGCEFVPAEITPQPVEATVEIVEVLGNETFLHLEADGVTFLARVDPRVRARMGERTRVVFDLSHLHLFEADSGEAIALEEPARAATA
jgi:multiple sugar transport system ATP-binding protein